MTDTMRVRALEVAARALFLAADAGDHDAWRSLSERGKQPWISQAGAVVTAFQSASVNDKSYDDVFRALHYLSEAIWDASNHLHESMGEKFYALFEMSKHFDAIHMQHEKTKQELIAVVERGPA